MVASVEGAASLRMVPPDERAFEIYRLIEVDGVSTRAVARQIGLSQTRVVQLRDSVEHWVAHQPNSLGLTKQQRMQAAEYKPGLRLDHLYSLALEAFRQSQGPESMSEEATGGGRITKTRTSQGNTRYLQMAMRIAAQQSRIPSTPISLEAEAGGNGSCDVERESAIAEAMNVSIPPEEDCSVAPSEQGHLDDSVTEQRVATVVDESTSAPAAQVRDRASASFGTDLFPVQTDLRVDESDSLGGPVLTRKQRKRRDRMLAALRKA